MISVFKRQFWVFKRRFVLRGVINARYNVILRSHKFRNKYIGFKTTILHHVFKEDFFHEVKSEFPDYKIITRKLIVINVSTFSLIRFIK